MIRKIFIMFLMFIALPSFAADIDEMTGQMILVGFNGNSVKSKGFKQVLKQVKSGEISGVIFFEDNIKDKNSFLKMTDAIKNSGALHTPFIAIDMEGGIIQRMNEKNGFRAFKTAKETSKMTTDDAYKQYDELAKMLKEVNINLNFAPCVDLAINKDSIIEQKERSYSSDPEIVTKYAREFIKAHYDNKIITSLKHFPGHGTPSGDTHLGFVDATDTYQEQELYPYMELANSNPMQTVMISHLYNKNIDEIHPASLSYKTIEKFLRVQTDFEGVTVTDDLNMGAISRNYDLDRVVSLAINAGENILLFSNRQEYDPNLVEKINFKIKQGLIDGEILPELLLNSYNKIIKLKSTLE